MSWLRRGRRVLRPVRRVARAGRARVRRFVMPVLKAVGRRVRDGVRSTRAVRYRVWLIRHALRHRAVVPTSRTHAVAALSGPATQDTLRNFVAWQLATPGGAPLGAHGRLRVTTDGAQLDRVLSLICVCGTFDSVTVLFEDVPAPLSCLDLGQPQPMTAATLDTARLQRAFLPLGDARRTATSFLKVAHPGAFVVAVSLPEDDDGFADDALAKWLPDLRRFRRDAPGVGLCLLNRTTLVTQVVDEPATADVSPVRGLGFGLVDAIALAQMADAFIGRLDMFGLAALAAGRPGVYLDPVSAGVDRGHVISVMPDTSPAEALELLIPIVAERRHGRRTPARPLTGGASAP